MARVAINGLGRIGRAALKILIETPELAGKFDGDSLRIPVPVGSIAAVIFISERATSIDESAPASAKKPRRSAIRVSSSPMETRSCRQNPAPSIVDLVKIMI